MIAVGLTNNAIKAKIEERHMSTEDLRSGSVVLPDFSYESRDENLDSKDDSGDMNSPCYSPISMDENVRSDSRTGVASSSFIQDDENAVLSSSSSVVTGLEKLNVSHSQDERKFKAKKSTKTVVKNFDDITKVDDEAFKVKQKVKCSVKPTPKPEEVKVKKEPAESPEAISLLSPDNSDDTDCILVSDGSDVDLGSIPQRKEKIVVDLKKVKKEKGVPSEDVEKIQFTSKTNAKYFMQKLIEKNESGCIECPMKCSSDFKNSVNMFKHIDDEVCTRPVNEHTNMECHIKGCDYVCVTKSSLRAHKLGHECPVPMCKKNFHPTKFVK